ncbi:MAG: peroxiredoxin [Opitutales bacterium]
MMGSALKSAASLVALLLLVMGCFLLIASMRDGLPALATDATPAEQPRGVFIHVSSGSDNPQRALMALQMGERLIENRERPVLLYFDIKGVELMIADGPEFSMKPFDSVAAYRERLIKGGALLQVSPESLAAAGFNKADLVPGVEVADPSTFFTFSDGDVLSFAY